MIVFDPTLNETSLDAAPDATVAPFTVTVALVSATVGVTFNVDVSFDTVAV